MRHSSLCLTVPFLILSVLGCSRIASDTDKTTHQTRAQEYFAKSQYREASLEWKNVVRIDPADAGAHYQLALAHIHLGSIADLQDAFKELSRSLELDATNLEAHVKLGQLYLMGNEPEKAKEQADQVLASAPHHAEAHALRGHASLRQQALQDAIKHLALALEQEPTNVQFALDLGSAYQAAGKIDKAADTLTAAINTSPSSAPARLARGDFYFLSKRHTDAESDYKQGIDLDPNNDAAYIKLANFYRLTNRLSEAEAICLKLSAQKPQHENPQIILGDFYTTIGTLDKALASYEKATALNPASLVARDRLLNHLLDAGKFSDAEQRIQTLLATNKDDKTTQFFQARLLIARGKGAETVPTFQRMIKEEPWVPVFHHFLGLALIQANQLGQAVGALTEAVRLAPNSVDSRTALASLHLAQRSYDLAIEQAQAAIKLNAHNLIASVTLGDAYLRKGDWSHSQEVFEVLRSQYPKEPQPHIRLGMIARAEKRDTEAVSHFEDALQLDPKSIEPLEQLTTVKVAQGKAQEARDRVARYLTAYPDNALGFALLGRLWMATKNWKQAEDAFKKSLAIDNGVLDAYMNLGQIYSQNGRLDEALTEYNGALAKNPKYIPAHMMLGVLYETKNETEKAQRAYETVLRLSPKFSPAANNLAWLLIEHSGNSDLALSYAQTAREQQPNDPHVADTLGWILYKKGIYLKAGSLLKEAAEKLPDNPSVLFHYGMTQYKQGDMAGAKTSLQTALKLSQTFPGFQEAQATLRTL